MENNNITNVRASTAFLQAQALRIINWAYLEVLELLHL
jgi:hypothetical protein